VPKNASVIAVLLVTAALVGCATVPSAPRGFDPGLVELAGCMSGAFSSREQAERDADFLDIRLHMVRIWPHRTDGIWLYVEQAAATNLERPYRQRIYRLSHAGGDLYESRVYEFPEPLRVAGAWRERDRLDLLIPSDIEDRQGCAILLRRLPDGSFAGSTLGRLCLSSHRGASYATSEVTLGSRLLTSWDRGFDASGKQVWGAEKGGYEFSKTESYRLE
jgi:hypothetical protein